MATSDLSGENADFYDLLKPLPSFVDATVASSGISLPSGWHVVVADVQGSTEAIRNGRYKQVNMLGAAVIACARNLSQPNSIPFVFGGDGATIAVPGHVIPRLRSGLAAVRAMGNSAYGLSIRVATFPVEALVNEDTQFQVHKYTLSPMNDLASLYGSGWGLAEEQLKRGGLPSGAIIPEGETGRIEDMDLSGLQCRWDSLPSKRGFKSCFIIVFRVAEGAQRSAIMQELNGFLDSRSFPGQSRHAIDVRDLKLTLNPAKLAAETRARADGVRFGARMLYASGLLMTNVLVRALFVAGKIFPQFFGGRYRRELIENTDFLKFDGSLKFVVDCSKEWLREFMRACDNLEAQGLIWYGQHSSKAAILTCLVPSTNNHVHFIDGSDGGYAEAAKILKTKMRSGG
ncbi:MAG: hypothetical protein RIQ81_1420 [Pseudomonadota bacterium]|jgi:hypothetical protein